MTELCEKKDTRLATILAIVAGITMATFILAGRWGIYRVASIPILGSFDTYSFGWHLLFEIRLWCVLAMTCLAVLSSMVARSAGRHIYGEKTTMNGSVFLSVLALLLYIMITACWSSEVEFAQYKAYEILLMGIAYTSIFFWGRTVDSDKFCNTFWISLVTISVALVCMGLPKVFGGELSGSGTSRLSVLGGGPIVYGRFIAICMIACMLSRMKLRFRSAFCYFLFLPLVQTGSRGAMLATFGGIAACLPVVFKWNTKKLYVVRELVFGVLIAFAMVSFFHLLFNASSFPTAHTVTVIQNRFIQTTYHDGDASGRRELALKAISMIQDRPIRGHGLAGWGRTLEQRYPHNLFLEVLVEGGIVGLVLLLVVFSSFAIVTCKAARKGTMRYGFLAIFVIMLVAAQFSGDLFDSRLVFAAMLFSTISHKSSEIKQHRNEELLTQ